MLTVPYYASLNRPFTFLGVERSLFFLILGICLPLAFSDRLLPVGDMFAGALYAFLHALGVYITRLDPQMVQLYRRHLRYRRYYAPLRGIHAVALPVYDSVLRRPGRG